MPSKQWTRRPRASAGYSRVEQAVKLGETGREQKRRRRNESAKTVGVGDEDFDLHVLG